MQMDGQMDWPLTDLPKPWEAVTTGSGTGMMYVIVVDDDAVTSLFEQGVHFVLKLVVHTTNAGQRSRYSLEANGVVVDLVVVGLPDQLHPSELSTLLSDLINPKRFMVCPGNLETDTNYSMHIVIDAYCPVVGQSWRSASVRQQALFARREFSSDVVGVCAQGENALCMRTARVGDSQTLRTLRAIPASGGDAKKRASCPGCCGLLRSGGAHRCTGCRMVRDFARKQISRLSAGTAAAVKAGSHATCVHHHPLCLAMHCISCVLLSLGASSNVTMHHNHPSSLCCHRARS